MTDASDRAPTIEERTDQLIEFTQNSDEVLAYVDERTVGTNPGFVFTDAAKRLVFGGERIDPTVIMVVTPDAEGFELTVVKASKHAQPYLVAMESNEAHEDTVGIFPTPLEAFQAGVAIIDNPYDDPQPESGAPTA